jgi:hypothetical protein
MGKRWTEDEIELLVKYYPYLSAKEINEKYINRTPDQINDYARKKLKIKKNDNYVSGWSTEQLNYIKENYSNNDIPIEDLANTVGKSSASVTYIANTMNLVRSGIWSQEEKEIVSNYYSNMKTSEIQSKFLNNKTVSQITKFANDNNLFKNEDFLKQTRIATGINNFKKIPDQSGANSPRWVNRHEINCADCGSVIIRTENKLSRSENHFCNYECMGNWMSINLLGENNPNYENGDTWTEEMRQQSALRSVQRLLNSDFKFTKTKPETLVDDMLEKLNIISIPEYDCKYYLIDRYLPEYNLMIEIQGNFYHCNPTMSLKNSRSNKILRKDTAKNTYLKKYNNVNVLYLWEKDIINEPELCEKLIDLYVLKNGKLKNYHSFNYEVTNNELKMKEDTVNMNYGGDAIAKGQYVSAEN